MRLLNYRLDESPKLMIIPMIDIIFFLLVYFMFATLYAQQEQVLPISLPQAASAQAEQPKSLTVSIAADGRIRLAQDDIALADLGKRTRAELVQAPETTVVIRADRHVEYETVVLVLDTLRQAGVRRLAVATEQAR